MLPEGGVELPVAWGDIGPRLIALGVIDEAKFKQAVKLTPEQEEILTKGSDKKIVIDATNGQFIVDMLWALGLAQKSIVYEEGPMGKEYKKEAGNFASTGGWSLARGEAMQYLNRYDLIKLTPEQQKKWVKLLKTSTVRAAATQHGFPTATTAWRLLRPLNSWCLRASMKKTIYRNVLALNSYWFSDTYVTIATLFARDGIAWKDVDAKRVLGREYSSAQGAQAIMKKVGPLPYKPQQQGGGCGA